MLKSIQAGTIGTIAGSVESGYAGDAGPATAALLNEPKNIAVDATGNLYIADSENHLIRKVDTQTGIIMTIAGTFMGEDLASKPDEPPMAAFEEEEDSLADPVSKLEDAYAQKSDLSGMVRYFGGTKSTDQRFSGDGGPATKAALNFPSAVADDGTVYIADTFSSRIRKLDCSTGIVDAVVGGVGAYQFTPGENESSLSLSRPYAMVIHPDGRLFITDSDNHLIRVWNVQTKEMSLLAGNGKAEFSGDGQNPVESSLNYPFGVAVDSQGHVYIADTFSHRIRVVVN